MSCEKGLSWYEMFPVVSFCALWGRCSNCKTKISVQYPLVELVAGIIFAGLFYKFQNLFFLDILSFSVLYAYYTALFSLLLVIAVYDIKHKIIPDKMVLVFGVFAFIGMFFITEYGFVPHVPSLSEFLSGLYIALPFAAIWFFSRGTWMGLGDAKLALGLGWFVGLSAVLSGVVLAFWSGAIVGLAILALTSKSAKKYGMKSEIPFAPFLVLGAFLAFILELNLFPI